MDKMQIEEEREKLREHYRKCVLIVDNDSVMIVEPDGRKYPWDADDSIKYNSFFREVLARDIFKEVIVKE